MASVAPTDSADARARSVNAIREPSPVEAMSDETREHLIDAWTFILANEINHELQCTAMRRQRELIEERSPEQVERMERERGLR
jgi:hypothetical protein